MCQIKPVDFLTHSVRFFVPPLPSREPLMVAGLLGPRVRAGGYTDTAHMSGAIAPS